MKAPYDDENELLWELGRKAPDDGSADLSDDQLAAYREGRLATDDAASCEGHLVRSPEARARLAELAATPSATPPPYVRDAVLASFEASFRRPAAPALGSAHGPLRGSLLKTAAIAALGLGMLLLVRLSLVPPEPLPADLAYDVEAEGLATVRQAVPGGREIEAYPETRVRITASPRPAAVKEIEFAVYRQSAGRLDRLELGSGLVLETIRGAAVLTGEARDLLLPDTGATRLFLVAARPGDLPATVELASSGAVEALEQAGRRRAYPVVIHLRPQPTAPQNPQ